MPNSCLKLRAKGYSIDAGLAVDARLVRSASSPLSKDKLEKINRDLCTIQSSVKPDRELISSGHLH